MDRSRTLLTSSPVGAHPERFTAQSARPITRPSTPQPTHAQPQRAAQPEPLLECVAGQILVETTVRLDGRHFVDCTIERCILEYWGGPVIILERTHFSGCRFNFAGEAAMTVAVLNCFGMPEEDQAQTFHVDGLAGKGRVQ